MVAPLITYAIPYYSGLDFLEQALKSVISQENPNWLAIVVDDCGGDDAEELVKSFKDERVSFFRNDVNLGLAGNWNKALALSSTELVTLLHSDDELEPTYTDVITGLMSRHPKAVAGHCRTQVIDEKGHSVRSLPDEVKKIIRPHGKKDIVTTGEDGLLSIVKGAWIFCPALCYRRSRIPSSGFSNAWKFVVDVDFMSRILFDGGTIVGTTTVAYRYRRHSGNQTVLLTDSGTRFEEEIAHLDLVAHQSTEVGWNRVARSAKRKTIIRLHLLYQAFQAVIQLKLVRAANFMASAATLRLR
jgi:glycosyltransferase involved in cell wall biosynthesis